MIERSAYMAFVSLGIIGPINGMALPYLIDKYSLSLGGAGFIFFSASFGFIVASSSYPWLQKHSGSGKLIGLGALFVAASFALLPLMPLWLLVLGWSFAAGLGCGVLEVGFNALIVKLEPLRAKSAMNWLHFSYSIGALSAPLVLSRLNVWTRQWMILYWAGAFIFFAFWVFWQHFSRTSASLTDRFAQKRSAAAVYRKPAFWLLNGAMFIYCGVEVAIAGWIVTYFSRELLVSAEAAAPAISLLWAGLTIGRAAAGRLAPFVNTRTLLLILFAAAGLFTALTTMTAVISLNYVLIFFIGLSLSAIYPSIVLHGTAAFPDAVEIASGALVTTAGIGALVIPALLGIVADYASLNVGFRLLAVLLVLALFGIMSIPRTLTAGR